jgi:hypothetical protein
MQQLAQLPPTNHGPFLRGSLPHIIHFTVGAEAPHRADFFGHGFAENTVYHHRLYDEASAQHDEIRFGIQMTRPWPTLCIADDVTQPGTMA